MNKRTKKKAQRLDADAIDDRTNAELHGALNDIFRREIGSTPTISQEEVMAPALRLLEERARAAQQQAVRESLWSRVVRGVRERFVGNSPRFRPAPILVGFGCMVAVVVIVVSNGNSGRDVAIPPPQTPVIPANVVAEGYTGGVRGTVPTPGEQVW